MKMPSAELQLGGGGGGAVDDAAAAAGEGAADAGAGDEYSEYSTAHLSTKTTVTAQAYSEHTGPLLRLNLSSKSHCSGLL